VADTGGDEVGELLAPPVTLQRALKPTDVLKYHIVPGSAGAGFLKEPHAFLGEFGVICFFRSIALATGHADSASVGVEVLYGEPGELPVPGARLQSRHDHLPKIHIAGVHEAF
jgi:hypothetical protein